MPFYFIGVGADIIRPLFMRAIGNRPYEVKSKNRNVPLGEILEEAY